MDSPRLAAALLLAAVLSAGVHAQDAPGAPQAFTLGQALDYATQHYPSVRAALEQVDASTAGVSVAKAASLPRLDAIWQTNRGTTNNVFGQVLPQSVLPSLSGPVLGLASSDSVWGTAVGALVSWEPFDLGLREAAVREAEAGVVRARAEERLTRLDVEDAVGSAFLGVVSAEQALAAARADLERREVLARAARALADNELRPGAEASRADAERAAAETRVSRARQASVTAQAVLERLLGLLTGHARVDASGLLDQVPALEGPGHPAAEHPLAEAGQAAVGQAEARETVLAKTDRPRLFLQSSVFARGSGANPDGTFDGGTDGLWPERANWAAGFQVVFPNLFDFTSLRARRAGAAALTRAERARYDEALLAVTSREREAQARLDAAREIARNTPVQLAAARQSEAQARARYEAGLASIVEVAETQGLLASAEYQDAEARVEVWRALLAQAVARDDVASLVGALREAGNR